MFFNKDFEEATRAIANVKKHVDEIITKRERMVSLDVLWSMYVSGFKDGQSRAELKENPNEFLRKKRENELNEFCRGEGQSFEALDRIRTEFEQSSEMRKMFEIHSSK